MLSVARQRHTLPTMRFLVTCFYIALQCVFLMIFAFGAFVFQLLVFMCRFFSMQWFKRVKHVFA